MKIYAKIKIIGNENLSSLYTSGDAVELEDGSRGTITNIDEGSNMVEVDLEDPVDHGMTEMQYQLPEQDIPLKKG